MTTIAFKDNKLVSDSRACNGQDVILQYPFPKIFFPEADDYWEFCGVKVIAFALCGSASALGFIKESLQLGVDHKTKILESNHVDFETIIVTELGGVFSWYVTKNAMKNLEVTGINIVTGPYAAGSGAVFATALMSIGKTAEEAVNGAKNLDPYTGGDTIVFDLPPPVTVRSVRPVAEEDVPKYTLAEVKDFLDRKHPKEPEPAPVAKEEEHPPAEIQVQAEHPTVQ